MGVRNWWTAPAVGSPQSRVDGTYGGLVRSWPGGIIAGSRRSCPDGAPEKGLFPALRARTPALPPSGRDQPRLPPAGAPSSPSWSGPASSSEARGDGFAAGGCAWAGGAASGAWRCAGGAGRGFGAVSCAGGAGSSAGSGAGSAASLGGGTISGCASGAGAGGGAGTGAGAGAGDGAGVAGRGCGAGAAASGASSEY